MAFPAWRRWLCGRSASRNKPRPRRRSTPLCLRRLEDRLTPSLITPLASFNTADGASPYGGLIMDSSGNLYGTTVNGGAFNDGTVFELPHGSGTIITLASFDGTHGSDPHGSLVMDGSGNLYGTTKFGGGLNNDGTVFELPHASGTINTLVSFAGQLNQSGAIPYGGLTMDGNGNLYGATSAGGKSNHGTVFELPYNSSTGKYDSVAYLAAFDNTDGNKPESSLVLYSGNLYGTTTNGGQKGQGTVFELPPVVGATINDLASFDGSTGGANPSSGLVIDGSGNIYGTTYGSEAPGYGAVFELPYNSSTGMYGSFITLLFNGTTEGKQPVGALVMDGNGNLYGTASGGQGTTADGTVFEVAAGSTTITPLGSFDGAGNGADPQSSLLLDNSGDLFGTALKGGMSGVGTIFELPGGAALTDQWTGANSAVDTNWSDGPNWSLGAPPTAAQTALFTKASTVQSFTSTVDAGFMNAIGGLIIDGTWGGTITVNSALSVNGDFALASGSFGGSAAVTVAGDAMSWIGGQIVLGAGGFTNTGVLSADTGGGNLVLTGAGTLTNAGTINEVGANALSLENTATLTNTGTLDLTGDGGVSQSGGGTLTNAGTLEKTGGTGTSTISSSFSDSAQITVQTGTLALASAGGASTGGALSVSAGATLDLTGGANVTYGGLYTGTGQGTVALSAGTLAVATGGVSFNMAGNLFQWTGGTIDVTNGNFTNTGTLTYPGSGNVVLTGAGSLVNGGRIVQTSTGSLVLENGTTLTNNRTYLLKSNGGISESGTCAVVNAGILEKSAGTGTSTIGSSTFSNTGTVEVARGTLNLAAAVAQVSQTTLTGGGWKVIGSTKGNTTLEITSSGGLTTIGSKASVTLNGLNTAFTNLNGLTTIAGGGHFSLLGGQSFTTTGALTDKGSLVLGPGSVLTVSGSFTQTSAATLTIELGGTDTAPTFGQLVSTTGAVALVGKLNVAATVVPAVGSSFEVLDTEGNAAVGGGFAGLPEGSTFTVTAGTTTMTFQISYVGADGDGNNNVVLTRTA